MRFILALALVLGLGGISYALDGDMELVSRTMTEDGTMVKTKWVYPDSSEKVLPSFNVPVWVNGSEVNAWIAGYENSLSAIPSDYVQGSIAFEQLVVKPDNYGVDFSYEDAMGNTQIPYGSNQFPESISGTDSEEMAVGTQFASDIEAMAQSILN